MYYDRVTEYKVLEPNSSIGGLEFGRVRALCIIEGCRRDVGHTIHGPRFRLEIQGEVHGDASAALGIIHRKGLGKTRHIQIGLLWVQQTAAEKRLKFEKVLGKENPADLYTKHLDVSTADKHVGELNCRYTQGRSSIAPELHTMSKSWDEHMHNQPWEQLLQLEACREISSQKSHVNTNQRTTRAD